MRNIYVSYDFRKDQYEASLFGRKFAGQKMFFSNHMLDKLSFSGLSEEIIMENYFGPQISDTSVTIVLIGAETGGRWWVDWEIFKSLRKNRDNERNGILGIRIPFKQHWVPQRLLDNTDLGLIIDMPEDMETLHYYIEKAYTSRYNFPGFLCPLRQRNMYA